MPDHLAVYFTRSTLKRTIMTYNYNATLITCWSYFKEDANLPRNFNDPISLEVWPHFEKFYKFIQKLFDGSGFYFSPSTTIVEFFKKKFEEDGDVAYETFNDFQALLMYFELVDGGRLDVVAPGTNKKRITYLRKTLSTEPNTKKTFKALKANITHFFDAYIIRFITLKLGRSVITIHDSVGIDILSIVLLEEAAVEAFQFLYDADPFNLNKKNNIVLKVNSNFIFL